MANMMIDLVEVFPVQLSVDESDSGRVLIRGPFGHCAQPTSNGRLYKRDIMEREFKRLKESMKGRNLFGELDHPDDGRTSLKRVSHIVTNLRIEKDGEVVGELEPLPTPMGQILKALAKAGCTLGVSSRGRGSIQTRDDGVDEVQDDFSLKTYDVVDNPASKNAFPSVVSESEVSAFLEGIDEGHRENVRAAFTEAAANIETFTLEDIKDASLRAKVSKALGIAESVKDPEPSVSATDFANLQQENERLKTALADGLVSLKKTLREEVEIDVKAALLMDPQVAAAKTVLESIITLIKPLVPLGVQSDDKARRENMALVDALKVRDFDLATARMDREEALATADAKLMEAHLKTRIAGHPKAHSIVKMIGPMGKLSGMDDLETRIEAAFEAMGSPKDTAAEVESEMSAKLEALSDQYKARVTRLEEDLTAAKQKLSQTSAKLKEAVSLGEAIEDARVEAVERAEAASIRLYAAEKTLGRPDMAKIMQMCESADSTEAVDKIIRANRVPVVESDTIRDRVRRSMDHVREEVEPKTGRSTKNGGRFSGESFQIDLDEAAALAGVSGARQ